MPRPKKEGAPAPKKRSRTGCWPCKARKVKCGEEKPRCLNCDRQGEPCDYSIRLNWGGRTKNKNEGAIHFDSTSAGSAGNSPSTIVFPTPEALTGHTTPSPSRPTSVTFPRSPRTIRHARSHSNLTASSSHAPLQVDPGLARSFGHSHSRSLHTFGHGIGHEYLASSNIQTASPLGLAGSMPSPLPRANITSAPSSEHRALTFRPSTECPSPSGSNASPAFSGDSSLSSHESPANMLPPFRGLSSPPTRAHTYSEEPPSMLDHRAKRMRVANLGDGSTMHGSPHGVPMDPLFGCDTRPVASNVRSPKLDFLPPYSPFQGCPLTPDSSVASSEEQLRNGPRSAATPMPQYNTTLAHDPPDLRRLSVASLINDPDKDPKPVYRLSIRQYPITSNLERTTTYGYDLGRRDWDTPRNNDAEAIMIFSPPVSCESRLNDDSGFAENDFAAEFGLRSRDMAFEPGGYYAKPVPIKIPQDLEPLPPQLSENGMNLLYFHHFLNHTARILVPHDCDLNPFRMILPQMALKDPDLLNLLLSYSASHRARLLNHPEPANRIAMWVKDLFPKLRHVLMGTDPIPIEALATAIMLASLAILSPNPFEVNIPWRDHLSLARQIIIARGGPRPLHRQDKVSYFLSRWFAYLDVMGSLSGRKIDKPLSSSYWADDNDTDTDEGDFQIDCLMGFTTRCVKILARVAELAQQVEIDRLDANGDVRDDWRPQPDIVAQAEQLQDDLREAREHVYKPCPYRSSADSANEIGWDSLEIIACNDMFHWAGLIQIDRRILNIPLQDAEVQTAVREIVGALYKIRPGSTAEANILFPLFTAGCHALEQGQRDRIISRLYAVEGFGFTHMGKAGKLMQRVWDSGKPWESLVGDEFVG